MCVDRCAEGWLSPRLQLHNHVSPEDLTEEKKVGSHTMVLHQREAFRTCKNASKLNKTKLERKAMKSNHSNRTLHSCATKLLGQVRWWGSAERSAWPGPFVEQCRAVTRDMVSHSREICEASDAFVHCRRMCCCISSSAKDTSPWKT